MPDRIITAEDYARREGAKTVKERIKRRVGNLYRKYKALDIVFDERPFDKAPVLARIWQGSWIADCECGGAEFVSWREPIFYCLSCYNRKYSGQVRPVLFPDDREEIERLILLCPVDELQGFDDASRAENAKPLIVDEFKPLGYVRSWSPGETVKDIKKQLGPVRAWRKKHGLR